MVITRLNNTALLPEKAEPARRRSPMRKGAACRLPTRVVTGKDEPDFRELSIPLRKPATTHPIARPVPQGMRNPGMGEFAVKNLRPRGGVAPIPSIKRTECLLGGVKQATVKLALPGMVVS